MTAVQNTPTNLNPGSIALLGFNSTDPDNFSFALLTNVAAGTTIYFTDAGTLTNGGFTSDLEIDPYPEGVVGWTAPLDLPAGAVINSVVNGTDFFYPQQLNAGHWLSGPDLQEAQTVEGVTTGGDQLIAFQADLNGVTLENIRFLFALQSSSNVFQEDIPAPDGTNSDHISTLPEGLIVDETALALGFGSGDTDAVSNLVYTGPTVGTLAELQAAVANRANWSSDSDALPQLTSNFTITDGGATGNAAPEILLTSPLSATEDTGLSVTGLSLSDTEGDEVSVTLTGDGTFEVTGAASLPGSGTSEITLSGSLAEVNGALAALIYTPVSNNTTDEQIQIVVSDNGGLSFTASSITVEIAAVDDAPVIANTDATVEFTSGELLGGPQLLFTNPDFSDVDTSSFEGGRFHVEISSGGQATDQLSLIETFTVGVSTLPGIYIDGSEVFYNHDPADSFPPNFVAFKIGDIISDGSNGSALTIDLDVNEPGILTPADSIFPGFPPTDIYADRDVITVEIIDALLDALAFTSSDPQPGTRSISVTVTDPAEVDSNTSVTEVTIVAGNVAPVLSDLASSIYIDDIGAVLPQALDPDVSLIDVDSNNFDGGVLTVSFGSLRDASVEHLSVLDSGVPGVGINLIGNTLSYNAVTIGSLSSDGQAGANLVVDLVAGATPVALEALIEALSYSNTAASPSGGRDVTITLTDGDGGTSVPQTINVQVGPAARPADLTIVYTEGDPLSVIDDEAQLTVAEPTSGSWAGGTLVVSITGGGVTVEDLLEVDITSGPIFADISSNLFLQTTSRGNVLLGTAAGGSTGTDLTITFFSGGLGDAILSSDIEALIQAIGYRNTELNTPTDQDRTVNFTLTDSGTNVQNLGDLTVDVEPIETASDITGLATSVSFDAATATGAAQVLDSSVTVTDIDTTDFRAHTLTVDNLDGLAGDQLSVGNIGDITVINGEVFFQGSASRFATLTGGSNGSDLLVTFDGNDGAVKPVMVEALIAALQFQNTASAPENSRDLAIILDDGVSTPNRYPMTVELTGVAVNASPDITGLATSVSFASADLRASNQVLDSDVFVSDSDSADFNGGQLSLSYATGRVGTENQLDVLQTGDFLIVGTELQFQGSRIGEITSDGVDGANLVIDFDTTAATPSVIEQLIENLTYGNSSTSPDTAVDLLLELTDGDGGSSGAQALRVDIVLNPLAQDDTGSGNEDSTITIPLATLLVNDVEFNASTQRVSGVSNPVNGSVEIVGTDVVFTPTADYNGPASFDYTVTDDVTTQTATVNLTIDPVNDAPTILNSPSDLFVIEDAASDIDLSGITLDDIDGDVLTLTLTASAGTMTGATYISGITVGGYGTGVLTLSGALADLRSFLSEPANIQYYGPLNVNGDNAATLTLSVSDGNGGSLASDPVINLDLFAENDLPTLTGSPSDLVVTEDVASPLDLSSLWFDDVEGDALTVTLTASAGTLSAISDLGVTVSGSGTGVLTLSGSIPDINNYLMGLNWLIKGAPDGIDLPPLQPGGSKIQYTSAANANGDNAATLTISANDGNGGNLVSDPVINLDITPVNDAPTLTGSPSDLTVTEDVASGLDLSSLWFADIEGDALTVTLTASAGVLTASDLGGVTVSGSGTGVLTLSGSISAIHSYLSGLSGLPAGAPGEADLPLALPSHIQYTGAANSSGDNAAMLTISASDGNGGVLVSDPVINIDITPVNDAPTLTGSPSDLTVTEDAASGLDLSDLVFADVEGDTLTVTLTASAGTLSAISALGVTVSGSGSTSLTLSGSIYAIHSYLNSIRPSDLGAAPRPEPTLVDANDSYIQYTGAANANGDNAATLTISVSDGNGGGLVSDPVINLDITPVNDLPAGQPGISGLAKQGETLTADRALVSDIDGIDAATVTWQWLRDGVAISGATADSFVLSLDDVGSAISVRLSYTDLDGTAETAQSVETDVVRFGDQTLRGDSGADTLRGRYGDDLIRGGDGNDVIIGGRGDDILYGGAGDDLIYSWRGNDQVFGGEGNDQLFGGQGNDILRGQDHDDILRGRSGEDQLFGGRGQDVLRGGDDDDTLNGGLGADSFQFTRTDGDDRITDFGRGNDVIEILNGPRTLGGLSFTQQGSDVLVSFGATNILVEDILVADLRSTDNFDFV